MQKNAVPDVIPNKKRSIQLERGRKLPAQWHETRILLGEMLAGRSESNGNFGRSRYLRPASHVLALRSLSNLILARLVFITRELLLLIKTEKLSPWRLARL